MLSGSKSPARTTTTGRDRVIDIDRMGDDVRAPTADARTDAHGRASMVMMCVRSVARARTQSVLSRREAQSAGSSVSIKVDNERNLSLDFDM